MKEKSYISVVVYIHQNDNYTKRFIHNLNTYFSKEFENFEIFLINNTGKENLLLRNKYKDGHVSVINLPWKHNIETAMASGIHLSIGDFVIEIDSPENINNFSIIKDIYKKCTEGFDIVAAVPNKKKLVISSLFYLFFRKLSASNHQLSSEPIRIITRRALNASQKSKEKVSYRQISYLMTGFPYTHISYNLKKKYFSNKNLNDKISFALEIFLSHTDLGMKLTLSLSLLFLFISTAVGFYTIYEYFTLKHIAKGWTTIMLFLSFGFTGFFLMTGILTKYLMMVLLETKNKNLYTIKSIKRLT